MEPENLPEAPENLPETLQKRLNEVIGSVRYYALSDFADCELGDDESEYVLKADNADEKGSLMVRFSTFDVKDSYGDIIRASALADHIGSDVAMVWSHKTDQIIGKGKISTQGKKAIWEGRLFVDKGVPEADRAYTVIKEMGDIQEYSWGFRILEAKPIKEKIDGQLVWTGGLEITKAKPMEVSPVLKGALGRPHTGTLRIKAEPVGLTVAEQYETALAAVQSFVAREESLAETREEEGRPLNEVNVERLKTLQAALSEQLSKIDALIAANEPRIEKMEPIGNRFKFFEFRSKQLALYDTDSGE